jgi:hypothetical protein
MPFQYCCPQGHLLQGDESQVGQPCQCPFCGTTFAMPTPAAQAPPMGQGVQPGFAFPQSPFPPGGQPQTMPAQQPYPGSQPGAWPSAAGMGMPGPGYHQAAATPAGQYAFPPGGPMQSGPPSSGGAGGAPPDSPAGGAASPFELPPVRPMELGDAADFTSDSGLSFDPLAKASLPFDLAGGLPDDSSATDVDRSLEMAAEGEFQMKRRKKSRGIDIGQVEPKALHIPCPSGHPLEVLPEMLGKTAQCPICGKQFQLRHENSLEHRRRKTIEQQQEERKAGQLWLAWSIFAAVLVLIGLLVLVLTLGK